MVWLIVLFIIGAIAIWIFGVLIPLQSRRKKKEQGGIISGRVYNKYNSKELKGVKISLGDVVAVGSRQNFISENNLIVFTDDNGKFIFENLEIKVYWAMAEFDGKKAVRMVKLTKENPIIEELLFKI